MTECDVFLFSRGGPQLWSLGSDGRHVMDAISQCEHEVRRKGDEGQPTLWKLFFQKELFTPWHDSTWDLVSTDIIYRQVIRGLKSKKYRSEKVSNPAVGRDGVSDHSRAPCRCILLLQDMTSVFLTFRKMILSSWL